MLFIRTPDPHEQDESQLAPDPCYYQRILGLINVTIPIAVGPTGDPANAHGPPVYISSPHYCDCDPALAAAVEGLACDKAKHATFLDIEPITGAVRRCYTCVFLIQVLSNLVFEYTMAQGLYAGKRLGGSTRNGTWTRARCLGVRYKPSWHYIVQV